MTEEFRTKRTIKQIKLKIVSLCWGRARHLKDISDSLKSNWKTCENVCKQLAKEGILKEIEVSRKVVGYKVNPFIKEIVFNAYEPRDFKNDLYDMPKEFPIKKEDKLSGGL